MQKSAPPIQRCSTGLYQRRRTVQIRSFKHRARLISLLNLSCKAFDNKEKPEKARSLESTVKKKKKKDFVGQWNKGDLVAKTLEAVGTSLPQLNRQQAEECKVEQRAVDTRKGKTTGTKLPSIGKLLKTKSEDGFQKKFGQLHFCKAFDNKDKNDKAKPLESTVKKKRKSDSIQWNKEMLVTKTLEEAETSTQLPQINQKQAEVFKVEQRAGDTNRLKSKQKTTKLPSIIGKRSKRKSRDDLQKKFGQIHL